MILIMAAVATTSATAQSVTYNHDSSKQNQITVMETGGGSLTPEFLKLGSKHRYHIPIFHLQQLRQILLPHSHHELDKVHWIEREKFHLTHRKRFPLMQFDTQQRGDGELKETLTNS